MEQNVIKTNAKFNDLIFIIINILIYYQTFNVV